MVQLRERVDELQEENNRQRGQSVQKALLGVVGTHQVRPDSAPQANQENPTTTGDVFHDVMPSGATTPAVGQPGVQASALATGVPPFFQKTAP